MAASAAISRATISSGRTSPTSSAIGVTPATADHTSQSSDYGFEFGGPLLKNQAWFYGSYSKQMIQVYAGQRPPSTRPNWRTRSQVQLAGHEVGPHQLPLLQRHQDQRRAAEQRHQRQRVARGLRSHAPSGQRLQR
jgi:hypothetical protein